MTVLWAIIVVTSLTTALSLVWVAWAQNQSNPTITVTDSTHYPIWNYHFPAVTICNYNSISKRKAYEFAKSLKKPDSITEEELAREFIVMYQLISTNNRVIPLENLTKLQDILDNNGKTAEAMMEDLAPTCDSILITCKWKGEQKRCDSLFERTRSSEGMCCSFNYYGLKNHQFSGAMPMKHPKTPRRVTGCGYQTALEVLIDNNPDDYFATQFASVGCRILNSYLECENSLTTALSLVWVAWAQNQSNPTITVTDSTHYPIWNYHFPAVTICNYNSISKRKAYEFAKSLKKPDSITEEELAREFIVMYQLISTNNRVIPLENLTKLQDILDNNGKTAEAMMEDLAPTCDSILITCKWKGEQKRCDSLFERTRSSEGMCCSFNYYGLKNHQFSGAMPMKHPKTPRRVTGCGYQTALEVLIDNNPDDYFATQFASVGCRVFVHDPYNFPDWSSQSLLIDVKTISFFSVNPTITYSTERLRDLAPEKRQCHFPDEVDMYIMQYYSYHNCLTECRMEIIKKLCKCIPFYFNHPNGTYPKTRICDLRDLPCLADYRDWYITSVPGFDPKEVLNDPNHEWGNEQSQCNCLPDCTFYEYLTEASTGSFSRKHSTNQKSLFGDIKFVNHSVFRVFFNDLVGTRNRKDVYFSWHALLASFGGLLSLFVGFSFVSIFELIAFLTIRLLVDAWNFRKIESKNIIKVKQIDQGYNKKQLKTISGLLEPIPMQVLSKPKLNFRHETITSWK